MWATGILLGAVGVYIMVSLKEGMPAVQLFSKNIGWSIIFILAAALSIADAMAAESTGISAWLVELITPVVQGKSPSRPHRSNVCRRYGPHQRG